MNTNQLETLYNWQSEFPESISQLKQLLQDELIKRERLANEAAPLSIGIMGQVKAGKSSFLNSLLFNGQSLLPEAATPKTANLTRIVYAEKPYFIAHYYHPDDWAKIEQQAASTGLDEVSRAAKELVQSVRDHKVDVQQTLAQQQLKIEAANWDELVHKLNDYVGSDGRMTALVRETELAVPSDMLKGIEVVDTPGMNDPVVSRTHKTREYMAKCDVVFFLSRSSQFLEANDQALLAAQLPQKGIKRLILIAAQIDSGITEVGDKCSSLQATFNHIQQRLSLRAKNMLEALAEQRQQQVSGESSARLLRSVGEPVFSSTHAWVISNTAPDSWNAGVKHTHKELNEFALDEWGQALSTDDWQAMANFEPLQAALEKSIQERDVILQEQRQNLETELQTAKTHFLSNFKTLASDRLEHLKNHDLASLEKLEADEQAQVDKVSSALSANLQELVNAAEQRRSQLMEDMQQTAKRSSQMQERTGVKKTRHSYSVSTSKWYNPFSWGTSRTESYSTTSTYRYLAASDAIENLNYYIQSTRIQLLAAFDDLLAPKNVSAGLRRELLKAIDTSDANFNPKAFRALIENSLDGLELPELDFEAPDVESLFAGFSGEVKNESDMQALRTKLETEVQAINQLLQERLTQTVAEASQELKAISSNLHARLTASLQEKIAKLRDDMANKEAQIKHYQALVAAIDGLN